MKFNIDVEKDLLDGIKELSEFFPIENEESGITLTSKPSENGLKIVGNSKEICVYHSSKAEFFYGLSFCLEHYGKDFHIERLRQAERLGVMRDCARNATLSVQGAKKLIACLVTLGYDYFELYVEDLMEIKEYNYLGNGRGRYSGEEIREIVKYALALGVEVAPCIQTLAHLRVIFRSDQFTPICDRDDILLIGEEKTYEFIDKMLEFCEKNFVSRRINIGMDEAQSMLLGQYLKINGYQPDRGKVFLEHLNRVLELCRKRNFKASMWSDMIFKTALGIRDEASYLNLDGKNFSKEFVDSFPKDVTLIFWDYYHENVDFYDKVFKKHKELTDNFAFAGGVWTWCGFVPLNSYAESVTAPAIKSGKKYGCKDYLTTSWGDDGGECSTFMALSSFAFTADRLYGGNGKNLDNRLKALFGYTYKELKSFEDLNRVAHNVNKRANPSKYALYNDVLLGLFDAHVTLEMKDGFKKLASKMKRLANKKGTFDYLFYSAYRLCVVLSNKATLGLEITKAYKQNDKATLKNVVEKALPLTIKQMEEFCLAYRKQWQNENKSFGYEIMDVRFGGIIQRLKETKIVLTEYLDGTTDKIEMLERERLPIWLCVKGGETVCHCRYANQASGSLF